MTAAWRQAPERGAPAAMAILAWLSLSLGRTATRYVLPPLALYYYTRAPEVRRASRGFLARGLGRMPVERDVLRHLHAFASMVHDRVLLAAGRDGLLDIAVHGEAEIERLLARGRGCLLVGSHLGSFEVLRTLGRAAGRPLSILMHEDNARQMQALISRLAPELQARVIAAGRPESMLRVKECLDRGETVGLLGDRALGAERTARCAFLGAPAPFPLGPWLLAAALGAPVALFFGLYRGGARYEVELEPFSEGVPVPRGARDAAAADAAQRYAARLEHYARRAPYNWFNFYDFWDAGRA